MSDTQQVSPVALREARERTINALCAHFAEDRLDMADFEGRLDRAHRATALAELDALLADLPQTAAPQPARAPAPAPPRPPAPEVHRQDRSVIFALLANNTRRGAWAPARRNVVLSLLGGVELDFRDVALPLGTTEIDIFCFLGSVNIIVPPDLAIEVSGIPILGDLESVTRPPAADDEAPFVRVNAFVLLGSVEVSVRLPGESARDAKRRIREEKRRKKRLPPST